MFRWPGRIKPGQVSNEMVAHLDLLPTLLATERVNDFETVHCRISDLLT
jgi:arylsulfatase